MAAEQVRQLADVTGLISAAPAATTNIYQRLNAIMKVVRGVGKHGHNKHGGYSYAGHEAITDAVRDQYVKQGVVRTASVIDHQLLDGGTVMVKVKVSWVCTDNPISRLDVDMVAVQPTQTKLGGLTAQQMGQAVSYAVKNAELKCLSLTGDDTPDSDESDPNGPRDDGQRHSAPQAEAGSDKYMQYLAKFGDCRTTGEVGAVNDWFRKNWEAENLRAVPGLNEQVTAARGKAYKRVKEQAADPDKDGR